MVSAITRPSSNCSAGDCAAGGTYKDSVGRAQAFVVDEKNGVWGKAIEVPGTATLNVAGLAQVKSVSCAGAGNCTAGGSYTNASGSQAFVVNEKGGVWGKAIEVPGSAALNVHGNAAVTSVSCAAAGNCAAGGFYVGSSLHGQAFVVKETNGVWGNAIKVPGTAGLNHGGDAALSEVSCTGTGSCAAAGFYADGVPSGMGTLQAFVTAP